MKKVIGSILCVLAILGIVSLIVGPGPDTLAHRIQNWAMIGVLLAIGIPLSSGRKKSADGLSETNASALTAETPSLAPRLAKASWVSGVIVVVFLLVTGRVTARVVVESIAFLLLVAGFVFGVIALGGLRQHGWRKIFGPALLGITINGLLLFVFVSNFFAARVRARQNQTRATFTVVAADPRTDGASSKDVVTRLCEQIRNYHQSMMVDTNRAEIIWSNGAMLEIGANFPRPLQEFISKPNHYRDIYSFVEQLSVGLPTEWKEASANFPSQGGRYVTVKSSDGQISSIVDPLYVEYLKQRYPSARLRIRGTLDPVLFVVDGRIRASVMPMKP